MEAKDIKNPVALLDGDIFAYRAAAATDGRQYIVETEWNGVPVQQTYKYKKQADAAVKNAGASAKGPPKLVYEPEPLSHAIHVLKENVQKVPDALGEYLGAEEKMPLEVMLSRGGSFRNTEVNKKYKMNRAGIRRPEHLNDCKDYLEERYPTFCEKDKLEADDLLLIRAEEWKKVGHTPIIVSIDKDLRQYSGWHYDFVKSQLVYVDELEAAKNFYSQLLTGDATDGIIGLKGVGPKTAEKLLADCTTEFEMYKVVLKEWIKRSEKEEGEEEEELYFARILSTVRMTAQLLYLLRHREERWDAPKEES